MRTVFIATTGFLGRIDSETRCAFWAEEPVDHAFDPGRLITVDLSRTPHAAIEGALPWDQIEVDDCYTGPGGNLGGTTLGPRWPELQIAGTVFLEAGFMERLPADIRPRCPPAPMCGRDYEHTAVLYWPHIKDARAGNRYAGHHAEIIEQRGTLAHVAVYPPGTSDDPDAQFFKMWIDLSSPEQCDAGEGSLTKLGSGQTAGPLFLIAGKVHGDDRVEKPGSEREAI